MLVSGYFVCAIHNAAADVPPRVSHTESVTVEPCPEVSSAPCPDIQDCYVKAAARALVQELGAEKVEDREKAATALQVMRRNAGAALAEHITAHPGIPSATRAIIVLARIGSDVADDCTVTAALLGAAQLRGKDWPSHQFSLAAIDALGEINKYQGAAFSSTHDDPIENFNPGVALDSCDALMGIADDLLKQQLSRANDAASPAPTPTLRDTDFYKNLKVLHEEQPELLELAGQISSMESSPKNKDADPTFTKLADSKSFAASLKKIATAYLDTTKKIDESKLKLENSSDNNPWRFRAEAAYDLLSETTQLRDEIDTVNHFAVGRSDLRSLLAKLANIAAIDVERQAAVTGALNAIFSTPPAAEKAKKSPTKDDEKKDADKKDSAAAAKDAGKEKSKTQ